MQAADPDGRPQAFDPVVDAGTRLLILGSLPGAASLAAGRYYAHPQNGFWRLVGGVIGVDLAARDYPARLAALRAHGIGLWDMIATASRHGSLDAAIRDPVIRDLPAMAARLPALRAIAFNGGTAARAGLRQLGPQSRWHTLTLLSSSPACARPAGLKQADWMRLAAHLAAANTAG
ncbi:DNA-deoxyinosine glycosylase [Sphingomonas sp. 1P06PA]|uniref:DNA-deoxyinosine glycosylase n=1 Tax=Sphingomonas sp. 1P06PA TaxID=554121 RepID=UPI0039A51521